MNLRLPVHWPSFSWRPAASRPSFGWLRLAFGTLLCVTLLQGAGGPSPIALRDVTRETGISFVHTDGGSGRRYIVESVSAGLALFDYDGDGLVDIYFLNGAPLPGTPQPGSPPRNRE
jgi:hypothetical protein